MKLSSVEIDVRRRYATSECALTDRPGDLERDLAASGVTMPEAIVGSDVAAAPVRYPGGKNGAGIYQRLINQMPPHQTYVEAFLGSGAILRRKRPAERNVGIDLDAGIIAAHAAGGHGCEFLCAEAVDWIRRRRWTAQELIYCDPPYLGSARCRPERALYRYEMMGEKDHEALLQILTTIPAMVMISGYASPLYERALRGWRRIEYQAMTRGGLKNEALWLNFPEPAELHDYRFLGTDFHDRCRIGRKIGRWTRRLAALPTLERAAVIAALNRKTHGSA